MSEGISLYIHIPFCKSKCIYCDFYSRVDSASLINDYTEALCREIAFYSKLFSSASKIQLNTLYIGGGTPSLLSLEQLDRIFNTINKNFFIKQDAFEATIELNPDDVTEELIDFLNESLITRVSVGIQSLSQKTLTQMKRRSSRETALKALRIISSGFKKRFSADLIAGFPGEDEKKLLENIDCVCDYNPEHISLYSLCVEEGTCLFEKIENGEIRYDSEQSDRLWLMGKKRLEEKGYTQYEVSNFSKSKNTRSSHNLVYWHLKDYLGAGSGATGSFFHDSSQAFRYTNTSDIKKYIRFWLNKSQDENCLVDPRYFRTLACDVELIAPDVEEFEFFMMNFRLAEGVSEKEYRLRFNGELGKRLGVEDGLFASWMAKGLAEVSREDGDVFFKLTDEGLLYLNSFLEKL